MKMKINDVFIIESFFFFCKMVFYIKKICSCKYLLYKIYLKKKERIFYVGAGKKKKAQKSSENNELSTKRTGHIFESSSSN